MPRKKKYSKLYLTWVKMKLWSNLQPHPIRCYRVELNPQILQVYTWLQTAPDEQKLEAQRFTAKKVPLFITRHKPLFHQHYLKTIVLLFHSVGTCFDCQHLPWLDQRYNFIALAQPECLVRQITKLWLADTIPYLLTTHPYFHGYPVKTWYIPTFLVAAQLYSGNGIQIRFPHCGLWTSYTPTRLYGPITCTRNRPV